MTYLIPLLWALPAAANRLAVPRLNARPTIAAFAPAVRSPALSLTPAMALSPRVLVPMAADAPGPTPAPVPAVAPAPAPESLLGKTAHTLAATSPEDPAWDRQVFDAMFSGSYKGPKPWTDIPGSPQVVVGQSVVDRRATGAREILKTLVLPNSRPVLGLFTRDDDRIVNGYAMGTQGIYGHKDAVPPGFDIRHYGGYTFRLARDGTLTLIGSGHMPADLSARLLRNLKRHYGITPAVESSWERFRRGMWAAWDGVAAFLRPKS